MKNIIVNSLVLISLLFPFWDFCKQKQDCVLELGRICTNQLVIAGPGDSLCISDDEFLRLVDLCRNSPTTIDALDQEFDILCPKYLNDDYHLQSLIDNRARRYIIENELHTLADSEIENLLNNKEKKGWKAMASNSVLYLSAFALFIFVVNRPTQEEYSFEKTILIKSFNNNLFIIQILATALIIFYFTAPIGDFSSNPFLWAMFCIVGLPLVTHLLKKQIDNFIAIRDQ